FSFAIFSADWPIDSPVDGSAIAGDTGTRSLGRILAKVLMRAPSDLALLASTRMSARRREARIGISESASAPPAMITFALPSEIDGARVFQQRAGFGERRPDARDNRDAPSVETGH